MEEEKMNSKKKAMLICSITVVAVILIVGISYAFWQVTKVQEETNVIASGCLNITLEGNKAINLNSVYPITKEEGMKTTPYTFTLTNTCNNEVNFIVNLESLQETTFQNTSIRVEIDNETTSKNKLYSNYTEANKYFDTSKEARTLVSGTLGNNGTITYNLRMWIDEDTPNIEQNKIFKSKIVATAGSNIELVQDFTDIVKVGDYIKMTPTSTSYTLPNELSGCDGTESTCIQNELNPSELNLWRVIRKNDDGTVDMVSDKVSSQTIYFYGQAGYINFIGGLNTIAAQYTDGVHVERTRHMGYNNQTEKCGTFSSNGCPGDKEYQVDLELVEVAYRGGSDDCAGDGCTSLKANIVGTTTFGDYWLASRYDGFGSVYGRSVDSEGSILNITLVYRSGAEYRNKRAARPIITLKSDVETATGDGKTPETAYTLQ